MEVSGAKLTFTFRGKSGVQHEVPLNNRRLARVVKACRDLPGYDLFQYLDDDGKRQVIGSADVNDYLRDITGQDFTSKDFRTWAGTVLAAQLLRDFEAFESDARPCWTRIWIGPWWRQSRGAPRVPRGRWSR